MSRGTIKTTTLAGGVITVEEKGDFSVVTKYLERLKKEELSRFLGKYGAIGVNALSNATPVDTGLTAESWYYKVVARPPKYYSIRWYNSNHRDGIPIAVLIQYGHGTRNGGYVEGRDFIMPAVRPIFDQILAEVWREVTKV